MSKSIRIRKGLNIKLKGEADKVFVTADVPETFAIKPPDFHGLVPKLMVKEGNEVKAGTPLFYDKYNEKTIITSPVSGEVVEVKRGAKRKILEVKILADKEFRYEEFEKADPSTLDKKKISEQLIKVGIWPLIRQRPFSTIADPEENPKAIFISAFDSAPLAPDYDFILHGHGEEFQTGLNALAKLTTGKIHLNLRGELGHSKVFTNAKGVQLNKFKGPHPAGNVGVQIHHLDPINKGDTIWYLTPQDVLTIGRFFQQGRYDASRVVALTGSETTNPKYYKTWIGSAIKTIVDGNVKEGENLRYISGNVLTGTKIEADGYLGFYDAQITVIPEGDEAKFFMTDGWLSPGFKKFSLSRSYPSWLMPKKKYVLDTNTNGEERAFVMTGKFERVFPIDVYPLQLVKAIMVNDIELMEALGIYEVDPEDFALCEFVDTSKVNIQQIIREGLDTVKEEGM